MVCAGHLRAVSPPLPPSLAAGGIPKGMNSPATVSGFDYHAHAVPPFMRRRLRGRGLPPGDEQGRRMRVGGRRPACRCVVFPSTILRYLASRGAKRGGARDVFENAAPAE